MMMMELKEIKDAQAEVMLEGRREERKDEEQQEEEWRHEVNDFNGSFL